MPRVTTLIAAAIALWTWAAQAAFSRAGVNATLTDRQEARIVAELLA